MTIVKLASGYGDISVAAYGIVKKIDMFPLGISMGLCQGFMPLVGYNYASKNYQRMREVSVFSWKTALFIALGFVVCFVGFAPWLMQAFIRDGQTSMQTGLVKYSPADSDEQNIWTVWYDMDPAGHRTDYDSSYVWHVYGYMEKVKAEWVK